MGIDDDIIDFLLKKVRKKFYINQVLKYYIKHIIGKFYVGLIQMADLRSHRSTVIHLWVLFLALVRL